jgi:sugar lactone lactonase YvrE
MSVSNNSVNAKWMQMGVTVAGGNKQGTALNQLSHPWSVYIDNDQTIYVTDQCNKRIVQWKSGATNYQIVADGNENNQLHSPANVVVDEKNDSLIICDRGKKRVVRWPRQNGTSGETIISNIDCWGLALDNDGYLYVSDVNKNEVRRYEMGNTTGIVVAGGNGAGDRFNQLSGPYFIFVDQDHSVYVSDRNNHRVMKWMKDAKEGIVVAGGQGQGNNLTQLSDPYGVVVDQAGSIYVVDCSNERVVRWAKGATQGSVILGGNGRGKRSNQFSTPTALSFDRQGNLYVVDNSNHRVQRFNIDPDSNT